MKSGKATLLLSRALSLRFEMRAVRREPRPPTENRGRNHHHVR